MDGLPRNKKPLNSQHEKQRIALDDYLFERKLQEVYDVKEKSNDLPKFVSTLSKHVKKVGHNTKAVFSKQPQVIKTPTKPKVQLIDAPHVHKKRFAKLTEPKPSKLPKVKVAKNRKPLVKKRALIGMGAVTAIAGVVGVFVLVGSLGQSKKDSPEVKAVTVEKVKPDFTPLVPSTITDDSKIRFDPTKRVATYEDTIEGGRIVVSQQKLGETELKDDDFLRRTAVNFNLTQEVTTKKGQAYLGANVNKNIQFAMFIYSDFLLFIQTDRTYKFQTLVDYIDDLN